MNLHNTSVDDVWELFVKLYLWLVFLHKLGKNFSLLAFSFLLILLVHTVLIMTESFKETFLNVHHVSVTIDLAT